MPRSFAGKSHRLQPSASEKITRCRIGTIHRESKDTNRRSRCKYPDRLEIMGLSSDGLPAADAQILNTRSKLRAQNYYRSGAKYPPRLRTCSDPVRALISTLRHAPSRLGLVDV